MIHKDKTGLLIGGLFDVHNEVRQGRDEPDYHEAFKAWLEEEGIPFESKPLHELRLHGQVAHRMYPDFVAWDLIVIELKAKARDIRFGEFAQLFNYLKCRGGPLGLMANMGLDRVIHERVVFDPMEYDKQEDWSEWTGAIAGEDRKTGEKIRQALNYIYEQHQTGYSHEPTENLIKFEFQYRHLRYAVSPAAETLFRGKKIGKSSLDCMVIDETILFVFSALFDDNCFNISRARNYMDLLGKDWAVAVNFGKKTLEIKALQRSQDHG